MARGDEERAGGRKACVRGSVGFRFWNRMGLGLVWLVRFAARLRCGTEWGTDDLINACARQMRSLTTMMLVLVLVLSLLMPMVGGILFFFLDEFPQSAKQCYASRVRKGCWATEIIHSYSTITSYAEPKFAEEQILGAPIAQIYVCAQ